MHLYRELINAAKEIIKERPRTLKEVSKVNTQEFIDQKKEMFLVQMGHEIIMKEIEMFKRNADEKDEALKQSEDRLRKDHFELIKNREENTKETEKIMTEVEDLEKEKKIVEEKLKNISQKRDFLDSEIKKNGEIEQRLKKLEEFFIKITPKTFFEDYEKAISTKTTKSKLSSKKLERESNKNIGEV